MSNIKSTIITNAIVYISMEIVKLNVRFLHTWMDTLGKGVL